MSFQTNTRSSIPLSVELFTWVAVAVSGVVIFLVTVGVL